MAQVVLAIVTIINQISNSSWYFETILSLNFLLLSHVFFFGCNTPLMMASQRPPETLLYLNKAGSLLVAVRENTPHGNHGGSVREC